MPADDRRPQDRREKCSEEGVAGTRRVRFLVRRCREIPVRLAHPVVDETDEQAAELAFGDEQVRTRVKEPGKRSETRPEADVVLADSDEVRASEQCGRGRWSSRYSLPCGKVAQEPLPADRQIRGVRDGTSPRVVDLAGDRDDGPGARLAPRFGNITNDEALADRVTDL